MQSSQDVHTTPGFLLATGSGRPKTRRANLGLVLLLCAALSLALAGCTESAGLGDTSTGWSPVAAIAVPEDSGARINHGRNVDPLDSSFRVTDVSRFNPGQVIQLGDERLQITAIREQELVVNRGVDDTRPQTHADQAPIFTIGGQFTVFVATKQGVILALEDDGSREPNIRWNLQQDRGDR